eukprot:TRINITY_DN51916_c0_g1_i1.p1 TRINITY_DN51916_c0_g1~~TRINITY_DN51916_c0_g1_i1.p1  ORF type:complete len:521 (-),score=98.42 TRINITY_DN51916_c0_g1_i1:65-1627(-)
MPGTKDEPSSTRWFQRAFGCNEPAKYTDARKLFNYSKGVLTVKATGKQFHVGSFEVLSCTELQKRLSEELGVETRQTHGPLTLGDVKPREPGALGGLRFRNLPALTADLHEDPENAGAVFQVTSAYNCLSLQDPRQTPEDGVNRYSNEATQSTACAVSCPAATVFRNYFVNEDGQGGEGQQLDLVAQISKVVRNDKDKYFSMKNGFLMPKHEVAELSKRVEQDPILCDDVSAAVNVGVHWDTQVVDREGHTQHNVCQVFCSAAPVGYAKIVKVFEWEPFAKSLLAGAYDATLSAAALLAAKRKDRVKVYLTLVGGGSLGNRQSWLCKSIERVLKAHEMEPLDVFLVHPARAQKYDHLEEGWTAPVMPTFKKSVTQEMEDISNQMGRMPSMTSRRRPSTCLDLDASEPETPAQTIAKAFSYLDVNGDGAIDRDELSYILGSLDPGLFTNRNINRLLKEADSDCDGMIQYCEFASWVCKEDSMFTSRVLATASFVNKPSLDLFSPLAKAKKRGGTLLEPPKP